MTNPDAQWFDLDDDHGVLELHERVAEGVGLELHVAHTLRFGLIAWWERDDGAWLGMVEVGRA